MDAPFLRRLVFVSVVLVLVFAVVFTLGDAVGLWPRAPSPVFRNADLIAGFALIAFFVFAAFRPGKRDRSRLASVRGPDVPGDIETPLAGSAASRPKR